MSYKFDYLYGPVWSWRLGRSLGIDLLSQERKICSFNCTYCQIGTNNKYTMRRKIFVPTQDVIKEIEKLPKIKIDYMTFSGRGEPTLAKNIGEVIRYIKQKRNESVAVITNSSLIYRKDVQKDLLVADYIMAKLDAGNDLLLHTINQPYHSINLDKIVLGLIDFRKNYQNIFEIQIMFTKKNVNNAQNISKLLNIIKPDVVHLNTPLRPCAIKPISQHKMRNLKKYFAQWNVSTVYEAQKYAQEIKPINHKATHFRRN